MAAIMEKRARAIFRDALALHYFDGISKPAKRFMTGSKRTAAGLETFGRSSVTEPASRYSQ